MYCTLDDLIEAKDTKTIAQLSCDESNPQEPNSDVVELNITKACNVIDSYIGGRYKIPLQGEIPGIIKNCAVDIAIYSLYTRRNREISKDSAVYLDYQAAMEILKRISEKKMNLPGVSESVGEVKIQNGIIKTNKKPQDRYFDRFRMRGYGGIWN